MFKSIDAKTPKALASSFTGPMTDVQASLLYAMKSIESSPKVVFGDCTTYTDKAMVIEKLSVGKTYTAVALATTPCTSTQKALYGRRNHKHEFVAALQTVAAIELPWTLFVSDGDGIVHVTEYLKKYTSLVPYIVTSVKDVDAFDPGDDVGIVLLKHRTFKSTEGRESLLRMFKKKLEGYQVQRLIVDNFDALRLTYNDQLLAANFTWLIARKTRNCVGNIKINTTHRLETFIYEDYYDNPIIQVCKDAVIRKHFTVGFNKRFIDTVIQLPEVKETFYMVSMPKQAQKVSMGPLCYILLQSRSQDMDKILQARDAVQSLQDAADQKEHIKKLVTLLNVKRPRKITPDSLTTFVDEACRVLTHRIYKITLPITRLVEHIKDNECNCCLMPFEATDEEVMVLHCCQTVMCASCSNVGLEKCPRCRSQLIVGKQSIISLSEIGKVDFDVFLDVFPTMSYALWNPILQAVMDVVNGNAVSNATLGKPGSYIRDFLTGVRVSRPAKESSRRFAVYTTQKLAPHIVREFKICGLQLPVVSSLRKLESPGTVTDLLLVGLSSADRRKMVEAVYNCGDQGREYDLNVVRIELTT